MIMGLGAATAVQEATGTGPLVEFLRAWKKHPPGFTAAEIEGLLEMAAAYGDKIDKSRPLQIAPDYDVASLQQAVQRAKNAAMTWAQRKPWFGSAEYYSKTDPKVEAARKLIVAVYEHLAGVKTASAVVRQAQRELKENLLNPDRWGWWQKLKPFAIVGGILAAAAIGYPYLKPILSRLPARKAA